MMVHRLVWTVLKDTWILHDLIDLCPKLVRLVKVTFSAGHQHRSNPFWGAVNQPAKEGEMLHNPRDVQSEVHCDGNRVAEVRRVKCVETFGETVGSDDIKCDRAESKMDVGKLSSFFVTSQTIDEFVDLESACQCWHLSKASSNKRTCFCSSPSNLKIARREKRGPRATRLLCAM